MPQAKGLLFLSHSSEDSELTGNFGQLLKGLSLSQIEIWYSSDGNIAGGLRPGDIWFEKILERMHASSSIVALMTPNSVASMWVQFESGLGAALPHKTLMIVTHGIESKTELPGPLALWQAYRIDKIDDLRKFCGKLFAQYDIEFNEVLFNDESNKFIKASMPTKLASRIDKAKSKEPKADGIENRLIEHFDRRFFEIASQLHIETQYITYNIVVISEFDNKQYELEISDEMSVQDVLDQIYELINEFVTAYKYLETWILVHEQSGLKLVIREIAKEFSAQTIFKSAAVWRVRKLEVPYKPTDSRSEVWRNKKINK
jgi:hypothetical protein